MALNEECATADVVQKMFYQQYHFIAGRAATSVTLFICIQMRFVSQSGISIIGEKTSRCLEKSTGLLEKRIKWFVFGTHWGTGRRVCGTPG